MIARTPGFGARRHYFIDNSRLHFRELFVSQGNPVKIAYSIIYSAQTNPWFFATTTPALSRLAHSAASQACIIRKCDRGKFPPDFETIFREIENLITIK